MKVSKSLINKIIIVVFMIFCAVMLVVKIPCSYVQLEFLLESTEGVHEAELSGIDTDENDIGDVQGIIHGNTITFDMKDYYPVSDLFLKLDKSAISIQTINFNSRDRLVYQWSGQTASDSIIYYNVEKAKSSCTFSDEFIEKYNQIYSYDWRLKADILIPIIILFVCIGVLYILIKKAASRNRFIAIAAGIVVSALAIFSIVSGTVKETYRKVETNVELAAPSEVINNREVYSQSFKNDRPVCGIVLRFATYNTVLENDYKFSVYDVDLDTKVYQRTLDGADIEDNSSKTIYFGQMLEAGHEYRFSISAREENSKDTLSLWLSKNDQYPDGTLFIDGKDSGKDVDFDLIVKGPDSIRWLALFLFFVSLAAVFALCHDKFKIALAVSKLAVYALVFVFSLLKMNFYFENLNLGVYDEMAQISYVAYLDEVDADPTPDFENMKLLMQYNRMTLEDPNNLHALEQSKGEFDGKFTGTINYLGHPPLYFQLMRLTNSIHTDGDHVYVNLTPMRVFNMIIISAAIILMFFIGFTRIKADPIYHLLFALMTTSVPIVCYEACMINNDNLAFLSVVIFIWGAIRFSEDKQNYATYLLIAVGICGTMLTKVTAGLTVLVAAVIFVLWTAIKERSARLIFNRHFYVTLPLYLVTAAYFITMFVKYKTFQPSLASYAYEQYVNYPVVYIPFEEREHLEFWQYVDKFFHTFFGQWQQGAMWQYRYNGWANIGTKSMWFVPLIYVFAANYKKKLERFYVAAFAGIVITLAVQFVSAYRDFQYISGHGGTQSRYYTCMVLLFALIAVQLLVRIFGNDNGESIIKIYVKNFNEVKISKTMLANVIIFIWCAAIFYSEIVFNIMNSGLYMF
ncbi:MAG: hypothetical protein IJM37_06395 [Lachnospiraceae bacterium]|nr:hypothetical protein [Lachnospiraceae bacterium]